MARVTLSTSQAQTIARITNDFNDVPVTILDAHEMEHDLRGEFGADAIEVRQSDSWAVIAVNGEVKEEA